MNAPLPLERSTTVDALAGALRRRILDGELAAGAPLREQRLTEDYRVARHTVRAALRALANEGLISIEPHRGARVAAFDAGALRALAELRVALEVEAAHLALRRNGGRLPPSVHAATDALARACEGGDFAAVTEAHEALHHAIVAASDSPRIAAAHRGLGGEVRLFLAHLRPAWDMENLASQHAELVAAIERDGAEVLRAHIHESTEALIQGIG
jgi:DNA-binding GntR family transcriptional regulator